MLIIPWAVPAYITALTRRGMFDEQFAAFNHLIRALSWVNAYLPSMLRLEPVNWLGQATSAFAACIIANLGVGQRMTENGTRMNADSADTRGSKR